MIKCGQGHTFDAVRRGIRTSGGTPLEVLLILFSCSGVLSGVLGVTRLMMTERSDKDPFLVAPLLEYQGVSERL